MLPWYMCWLREMSWAVRISFCWLRHAYRLFAALFVLVRSVLANPSPSADGITPTYGIAVMYFPTISSLRAYDSPATRMDSELREMSACLTAWSARLKSWRLLSPTCARVAAIEKV